MESKSPERKFLTFAICFALVTDIHLMSGRMIFQSIDIAHKFSYDSRPYDSDARSSVGGMARLFGSRSASSIPNSGQQGQIESGLPRAEPGDFGQQSGRPRPRP